MSSMDQVRKLMKAYFDNDEKKCQDCYFGEKKGEFKSHALTTGEVHVKKYIKLHEKLLKEEYILCRWGPPKFGNYFPEMPLDEWCHRFKKKRQNRFPLNTDATNTRK